MGKRGPPPLPREVKASRGTLEKSREPQGRVAEYEAYTSPPEPPECIVGTGAEEVWDRTTLQMVEEGSLKPPDLPTLMSYCIAVENVISAQEQLRGRLTIPGAMGGEVKNPAATILGQAQSALNQTASLLGLNPSSRGRVDLGSTIPKPSEKPRFSGLRSVPPTRIDAGKKK